MYYKDYSYKISFILAALLHTVLAIILCIKIVTIEKQPIVQSNVNIIKAFSISQSAVAKTMAAPIATKQLKQQPLPQQAPQTLSQPQTQPPKQSVQNTKQDIQKQQKELEKMLKQQMLTAQTQEAQALNKELQIKNKELHTLQKNQEKQMLHNTLTDALNKEGKQLQKISKELESSSIATNTTNTNNVLSQGEQSEVDKYKALIIQAIAQEWIVPDDVDKNTSCKLLINVGPGGVVLRIQILQPSNNPLLDRSAQNAVWKASPLPIPPSKYLFDNFRSIQLTVRPEEIVSQ